MKSSMLLDPAREALVSRRIGRLELEPIAKHEDADASPRLVGSLELGELGRLATRVVLLPRVITMR